MNPWEPMSFDEAEEVSQRLRAAMFEVGFGQHIEVRPMPYSDGWLPAGVDTAIQSEEVRRAYHRALQVVGFATPCFDCWDGDVTNEERVACVLGDCQRS